MWGWSKHDIRQVGPIGTKDCLPPWPSGIGTPTSFRSPVRATWPGWLLVAMVCTLAAALAGVVCGRYLTAISGPSLGQLAFLCGPFLGLGYLFQRADSAGQAWGRCIAALSLIGFAFLLAALEPLDRPCCSPDVLLSVTWLSPLVLGGVLLPRRGCWCAACGCWLVLFSGTAALAYNVYHVHSGMGLLWRWID
jgi:hypothetical protein